MVIPDFYTKVDIHPHFAIQTLKSDEFARTKTWLFLIPMQKMRFINTLQFRLKKETNFHQNMVIPDIHKKN